MVVAEDRSKQGAHADPESPDYVARDPASLPAIWREALTSPEMVAYRRVLSLPGQPDVRASILDDLSTYYQIDVDECVRRCVNWESWSVGEWKAGDRSTPEGLRDFYNSVQSWSFDLLWWAYLQAEGCFYPTPVLAAQTLPGPDRAPRCLDFGSGVGDTAQLLIGLGYTVDLADISRPLLMFARWRLDRRKQAATFIDLNDSTLPMATYDAILAKDVLAHVPDFVETVTTLHRALKPGGLLLANIDVRPATDENAWHLYADDLPLRRALQDVGFEQVGSIDGLMYLYGRVEPVGLPHLFRRARNALLYGPLRRAYRGGRKAAHALRHHRVAALS